ncbi:MAG: hypothetical protein HQ521_01715 [Bacteroidetes bacterium]|nr:hypothetical protein [Bacteroidota bacterium]
MDKEKILIRLSTQVDTLKAHINRLKRDGYKVHSLDVDMLRQKTIEFYEQVFELEKLFDIKEEPIARKAPIAKPKVTEIILEDVEVVEIKEEKISEVIHKPDIIEEKTIVEPVVSLPQPEPEIEIISQPTVQEVVPEPTIFFASKVEKKPEPIIEKERVEPEKIATKQTTYDLFSGGPDNRIAEKYSVGDEQSIAEKMQKSHIGNIREAIGINEKFLFINELFNGDLGRYNKILDDINDLATKQGVDTYLFELRIQFQWADDNEAYLRLRELLDRKFS